MITAERVSQICSALTVAGAGWLDVARRLPEYGKHSLGVPAGPGHHRPWVLLNDEHEEHDAPVRLARYDNGVWFAKGEYLVDIERRGHGDNETAGPGDASPRPGRRPVQRRP